jgi:hypothetical protein
VIEKEVTKGVCWNGGGTLVDGEARNLGKTSRMPACQYSSRVYWKIETRDRLRINMGEKSKGIAAYILIAFMMAWALWEIPIRLGFSTTSEFFQFVALPGVFSPAIAIGWQKLTTKNCGVPGVALLIQKRVELVQCSF